MEICFTKSIMKSGETNLTYALKFYGSKPTSDINFVCKSYNKIFIICLEFFTKSLQIGVGKLFAKGKFLSYC